MLGEELIQFNNRRGTLSLGAEGDFTSENAEIYYDKFYFDGAGEKKGKEVVVWSHGDTLLGNLRGMNSVFIDRSTGVGVVSQGQSGEVDENGNKEAIFIHLDEATAPEAGVAAPEQSTEALRAQALALQPVNGDLGKSGEVSIKKNPQGETIVIAKGQVEVGFYGKERKSRGLLAGMPFFQGTNGKSEYELKTNGETNEEIEVKVRGQAVYRDRYYGAIVLKGDNVEVVDSNGGIHTLQDGASLSIARKAGDDTDLVTSTCFECTAGTVMTIGKNIFVGDAVGADGAAVFLTETVPFNIEVEVDEKGGFSYNTNLKDAGRISEMQNGKATGLGKFLNMRMIDSENPEAEPQQYLRLFKPSAEESLIAHMGDSQNGKDIEGSESQFNFGIRDTIGNAVILTSEKNSESMAEMNRLLEEGKISELSKLNFEDDPQLRKFILAQNGIDIEHINNPEYLKKVEAATSSQDEFNNWKVKIETKYVGVKLDDNGRCIAGCDKIQKAIQKADKLGYWYTQAKVKALDVQGKMLDAIISSEADGGEASGAKAAKSALLEEKKQIVQARKYLLGVAEQKKKEEERKQEETAQEYLALVNEYDSVETEYEQNLAAEKAASQKSSEDRARIEEEARERETAYLQQKTEAERVQAVSEGVPPSYESQVSLADESAIEALRRERVNKEVLLQKVNYARSQGGYASQEDYEKQVNSLNNAIQRIDSETEALVSYYIPDRPDYAAELALRTGNTELARSIAEEEVVLVSPARADQLVAESYAADEEYGIAAESAQAVIDNPEASAASKQSAEEILSKKKDKEYSAAKAELNLLALNARNAYNKEKALQAAEENPEWYDVPLDYMTSYGKVAGGAVIKVAVKVTDVVPAVINPVFGTRIESSGVKWGDPSYAETGEMWEARHLEKLDEERRDLENAIQFLDEQKAEGVDTEEALRHLSSKFTASPTTYDIQRVVADQLGEKLDPETAAAAELTKIQMRIIENEGAVYQVEEELQKLITDYPGTIAAQTAQNKINALNQRFGLYGTGFGLTEGTLELVGPTVIETFTPDALVIGGIGLGMKVASIGAKAVATTKLVQAAAKGAEAAAAAVKSSKAAEVTAKVVAPVMQGASKVGEAAATAKRVIIGESEVAKAVRTAKSEVAFAEKSLSVAKEIGGSPLSIAEKKFAQAVKKLDDIQTVAKADSIAKKGTVFGSKVNPQFGITSTEKAAIENFYDAADAIKAAKKVTGNPASLRKEADAVIAAARKVEDARLSNIIAKKVSSAFSTRFGAKAADDVVKQVDSLEEMGAVLKPAESSSGEVGIAVDTSGVSPAYKSQADAKAIDFKQLIRDADVDEVKVAQEALEVNKVPIGSEFSAGKAVMGELAAQEKAAKGLSEVIPITSKPSAAASVKKAVPAKAAEPIDFLAYKADQIEEEAMRNTVGKIAATENAKKVAAANDALPVVNKKLAAQRALKASAGNKKSSMQVLEDAVGEQSLAAKFDNQVTGSVKARSLPEPAPEMIVDTEALPGPESFIAEESLINDEIVSLKLSSETELPKLPKLAVVPKAEVENVAKIKTGQGGVVALGDLHGTKTGVLDDLNGVGTGFEKQRITGDGLNPDSWHWNGGDDVVVQVGDIYDRGDDAFALRKAFNRLDDEARAAGGRVVRITGNHEMLILEGKFNPANGMNLDTFWLSRKEVIEDLYGVKLGETEAEIAKALGIKSDKVKDYLAAIEQSDIPLILEKRGLLPNPKNSRIVAAAAVDGQLYTHAGVNLEVLESLGLSRSPSLTAEQVATRINQEFVKSLKVGDLKSNAIFDTKKGIFWNRISSSEDIPKMDIGFLQLRGHDVIDYSNYVDEIAHYKVYDTLPDGTIVERAVVINLDVGRSSAYGGGKGAFYNAPNAVEEVIPLKEIIPEIQPAVKLKDNLYELEELRYKYNPDTRGWEQKGGWFSKDEAIDDIIVTSRLEASRLEVPVPVAAESFRNFESITTRLDDGSVVVKPENLEKWTLDIADEVGDASTLTTDKIKELVLNRARASGMDAGQLEALSKNFDKLYQQSATIGSDIAEFSEKLAKVDDGRGFTNVHLFRDGSILGASDAHFQKLSGKTPNVRIIYVSRDTTLSSKTINEFKGASSIADHAESRKVGTLMFDAYHKAEQFSNLDDKAKFVIFRDEFQKEFRQLMETDSEFREVAQRTYLYLQEQGLLKKGAKLRFVDTCCTGTINYFLEGVVRYYEPNIEVESLLMSSKIRYLSAGFNKAGFNAEQLSEPVNPAFKFDQQAGSPLMELSTSKEYSGYDFYGPATDQVLSYLDELAVLQQTAEKAKASSLIAAVK